VWIAIVERAKRGDSAAQRLYLEYTAGRPVQELEVSTRQQVTELSNEELLELYEQASKALAPK